MFWCWVAFVGSADVNRKHKSLKKKRPNQNLQRETENVCYHTLLWDDRSSSALTLDSEKFLKCTYAFRWRS